MRLLARWTRRRDVDQCLRLMTDRFAYSSDELRALRAMWLDILTRDVGTSAVVVSPAEPDTVLAFGLDVRIDAQFMNTIMTQPEPFIAKQVLGRWRRGERPYLDESEIATGNSGDGVHVLALHNGRVATEDASLSSGLFATLAESFLTSHAGLNVRSFAHELFGWYPEFVRPNGFNIREDYGIYEHVVKDLTADERPFVATMTREQAMLDQGNLFNAVFFRYDAAKGNFNADERRLLRLALEGVSDQEVAEELAISPTTLKKRWARIYDTFRSTFALPSKVNAAADGASGEGRGAEMRRHVLRYIREHPSELHPYRSREHPSQRPPARSTGG